MLGKASWQFSRWKGVCSLFFKVDNDNSGERFRASLQETACVCLHSTTEAYQK